MKNSATIIIGGLCSLGMWAQCVCIFLPDRFSIAQLGAVNLADPQWWQFLTHLWLHGSPLHFVVNILVFIPFAREVESRMGVLPFVVGYLACGAFASAMALSYMPSEGYIVGCSGAVFGVIAMYGVLFFRSHIRWLFLPRPILVWLFLILLVIVEIICCVAGYKNSIIHLCGMFVGLCFTLGWLLGNKVNNKKA